MSSIPDSLAPARVRAVAASDRIELLDVLRGFALFGMVIVHFVDFAQHQPKGFAEGTDFVFANKSLSLFSLLFGIGFAVQMVRAETVRRPLFLTYLWRMLILFAIGAAHSCLIWDSILLNYAVFGCLLLLLRRLPVWGIIALASILMVSLLGYRGALLRSLDRAIGREEAQSRIESADKDLRKKLQAAKQSGTYAEIVSLQTRRFAHNYTGLHGWMVRALLPGYYYFPICLLGLAIVKSGLLLRLNESRTLLKRVMWCALLVGLISNPLPYLDLGHVALPARAGRLSFLLSGPTLALAYACGIALALQTTRGRALLLWLRWPGRMALTNYVGHTALVILVSYGFGLGLMNRINVIQAWGMGLVVFLAFTLFSVVWMKRYEFGPLEWLWRALALGRTPTRGTTLPVAAA